MFPVITEMTGNGIVFARRATRDEVVKLGRKNYSFFPCSDTAVGKWSWNNWPIVKVTDIRANRKSIP